MKEGCSGGPSLCEGLHEGDLEGGLLYWGPHRYVKYGSEMGNCFHRGPAFGEHGGALLLRAFLSRGNFMRFFERYANALLMGTSPQGPCWGTWRGFVCWDF